MTVYEDFFLPIFFTRIQKQNTFLDLDDGLARARLQVVIPTEAVPEQGKVEFQSWFYVSLFNLRTGFGKLGMFSYERNATVFKSWNF